MAKKAPTYLTLCAPLHPNLLQDLCQQISELRVMHPCSKTNKSQYYPVKSNIWVCGKVTEA